MPPDPIVAAEHAWLGRSYSFCRHCFGKRFLPSHDEQHHLRVWHFAKELIRKVFTPRDHDETAALLLACMLHDTGMSITLSARHGHESRRLAEHFFEETGPPPLRGAILEAIERHDEKDYRHRIDTSTPTGRILMPLAIADDLDAFGHTGIFRYFEIYALRRLPPDTMAPRIVDNLDKRFANMRPALEKVPALLRHHEERYHITRDFFRRMTQGDTESVFPVVTYLTKCMQEQLPPHQEGASPCMPQQPHPALRLFLRRLRDEARSLGDFPSPNAAGTKA